MAEPVKFIHASDFHLDQPIRGLAEIPNHIKAVLANAPYDAAQKVFDLAVAERVDFLLLSGDLLDMEAGGPRAAAFLLSNFERLADKEIEVYWCAGTVDHPDRWPAAIELPDNVVTFSSTVVEQVDHRRDGVSIATIYGCGFDPQRRTDADFDPRQETPFPIALTHGELEFVSLDSQHIRYWALGGRHKSNKLDKSGTVVVYPGTTQGRTPKETGSHSCRLCRVDTSGKLRVQTVDTDSVRWLKQKVALPETVNLRELKNELGERALKIATETTGQTVLINWYLSTGGNYNAVISKREWAADLLEWLRDEFGRSDRGVWSVSVTVEPPESLPSSWYEEDTILGEYLRAVGRYQSDNSLKLALHDYLPTGVEGDAFAGIGHVTGDRRTNILRNSALMGVEYLAAHKGLADVDPADA